MGHNGTIGYDGIIMGSSIGNDIVWIMMIEDSMEKYGIVLDNHGILMC